MKKYIVKYEDLKGLEHEEIVEAKRLEDARSIIKVTRKRIFKDFISVKPKRVSAPIKQPRLKGIKKNEEYAAKKKKKHEKNETHSTTPDIDFNSKAYKKYLKRVGDK